MRTNVELDDELVRRCMRITGLRTKKAVVDEAMRTLLRLHGQREVRDLRGRLRWMGPGERPADDAAGGGGDADPR